MIGSAFGRAAEKHVDLGWKLEHVSLDPPKDVGLDHLVQLLH